MKKHELADCENCPLNNDDAVFVPSDGPDKAEYVIIGEAPGLKEALHGKPFIGPSGRLLDTVLKHHSISRDASFLTNACLCRPANNDTPPTKAIKACQPRLIAEVAAREPSTILALGKTATNAIMGAGAITKLRVGPPKESQHFPGVKVVPTFHPAACLRAADNFPSFVNDIGKAVSNVTVGWKQPDYKVFDDPDSAAKALDELLRLPGPFVVDIETAAEKDTGFEHSNQRRILCIGIAFAPDKVVVITDRAYYNRSVERRLTDLLENRHIIAHNGKYDLAGLGRGKLWFDTMLASYCIDERPGYHGLGQLGVEILGTPDWKDAVKEYVGKGHDYSNIPPDILHRYNAYDCSVTYQLYEYYADRLEKENLRELHDFLVTASGMLQSIEVNGIAVDMQLLDELQERMTQELLEAEVALQKYIANPRSPKQVHATLENYDIKVPSTNVETLTKLLENPHITNPEVIDFLMRLLNYRKENKLYGTYVKGLREKLHDQRAFPNFLLHGTTTGRLSCRNPNLQNIPRGSSIRSLFVAQEGNVFVSSDYSQAELRTVACLAHDKWLQQVYADERDIHSEVARNFFGDGFTSEQRVKAKMVVFGLTYDMTEFGLARRMNIPVYEAKKYIKQFFSTIPDVVRWRKETQNFILRSGEDLVTPFGRHRRFWLITDENKHDVLKEALAFLPQSIASDLCLRAAIDVHKQGLKIRNIVHDNIMVECPEDQAMEVKEILETAMLKSGAEFSSFVPFSVDTHIARDWGSFK